MKKLGLCVRYDCNNYGSMLQILATQEVIRRAGWEYEIIRYDKKTPLFLLQNATRVFNPYFMRGKLMGLRKKKKMQAYPEIRALNAERLACFANYRKEHIGPYSPVFRGWKALVAGTSRYDAVLVGSDQLWTPAGIKSRFYNLLFVPDRIPKISLATSFGVSQIPSSQTRMTKKYLSRIDHLSVRELQGAKIVKALTGREAFVALDPTLLLSGAEWEEIFPTIETEKEPYIFAYFLGSSPENREMVRAFAAKEGLKLVTFPHLDEFVDADLTFGDEQRFDVDPVDFLNLLRGARYVCTDSFHGTVFSIQNHKQFVTFNRFKEGEIQSRNSRIDSLFALLKLEARRCTDGSADLKAMLDAPVDFDAVEARLARLRAKSLAFLDNALNGPAK